MDNDNPNKLVNFVGLNMVNKEQGQPNNTRPWKMIPTLLKLQNMPKKLMK